MIEWETKTKKKKEKTIVVKCIDADAHISSSI